MSKPKPHQFELPLFDGSRSQPVSETTAPSLLPPRRVVDNASAGSATATPGTHRQFVVNDLVIPYELRRSRRRTIGLLITDDGLRVTAPQWVAQAEIDRVLHDRSDWIVRRLQAWQQRQARVQAQRTRWEDGGTLPYLGANIVFRLHAEPATQYAGDLQAPSHGDTLWLALPSSADARRIRDSVQAWLQQRAAAEIGERLQQALHRTGLDIRRWRLSSAATRWGSCTSQGNIMLNWRLIHFPRHVIDYVIIHELAHLREMNHGPGFWAQVESLLPDYRDARDALRRVDPASLPTFQET